MFLAGHHMGSWRCGFSLKPAKCRQMCQSLKCRKIYKCLMCCRLPHVTPLDPDTFILILLWPPKPSGPTSERADRIAAKYSYCLTAGCGIPNESGPVAIQAGIDHRRHCLGIQFTAKKVVYHLHRWAGVLDQGSVLDI